MKKAWTALACLAVTGSAMAQTGSTVNLYGVIDGGVTYVNNQAGGHNVLATSGIVEPTRFGLTGSEDLGGGLSAIYRLESQFSQSTGALVGTSLFGRQAYVGLKGSAGTLTVGNQYDFMFDTLQMNGYDAASRFGGLYSLRRGPFGKLAIPGAPGGSGDFDRLSGQRIANSIKFTSNNYGGLTFGGMVGLGEQPGNSGQNRSISAGANYDVGRFGVAAAYTDVRYPDLAGGLGSVRNIGLGAKYKFDTVLVSALYTGTKNTFDGANVNVLELLAKKSLTERLSVGASIDFMKGNAVVDNNKAYQLNGAVDYALSKRTDIYALVGYQLAQSGNGTLAQAAFQGIPTAASGSHQALTRIGIRHRF